MTIKNNFYEETLRKVLAFAPDEESCLAEDSVERVAKYFELCDYSIEDFDEMADSYIYNLYDFDKFTRENES